MGKYIYMIWVYNFLDKIMVIGVRGGPVRPWWIGGRLTAGNGKPRLMSAFTEITVETLLSIYNN